jgi:hypothetical protein
MKKIFYCLVVFSALQIVSCASLDIYSIQQADEAYVLSYKPALGSARTSISFEGSEYLKAQEKIRAVKELRKPDYAGIPAVGIIVIKLNDGNIDGANPQNSLYILIDNTGKEIYRANGKDKIPDPDVSSYGGRVSTRWSAVDSFPVNDSSIEFPLALRVVRLGDEIVDITISESKSLYKEQNPGNFVKITVKHGIKITKIDNTIVDASAPKGGSIVIEFLPGKHRIIMVSGDNTEEIEQDFFISSAYTIETTSDNFPVIRSAVKTDNTASSGDSANLGRVWVNGYRRKNGTYVKGYWRNR